MKLSHNPTVSLPLDVNPEASGWILFAQVGRPHGVRGAFFLKTTDRRNQLAPSYTELLIETSQGFVSCTEISTRQSGGKLVVELPIFQNCEEVASAYNKRIYVHRSAIVTTPEEQLIADLLGMQVFVEGKGRIGVLSAVVSFGAQDNFEIKLDSGDTVLYPYIDRYVRKIDTESRIIEIEHIPVFLGEDEGDEKSDEKGEA